MDVSGHHVIRGPDSEIREEGQGSTSLSEESVVLEAGSSVYKFSYRDITTIEAGNYTVELAIDPETTVVLSKLGGQYEDFVRRLHDRRNEILIEDMLIDEPLKRSGDEADLEYQDPTQERTVEDTCEVRLYETAIVFLPRSALPIRLPFGIVTSVEAEDYTIRIETDRDEVAQLSKLGRQFDPLRRALEEVRSNLTEATVDMLANRLPEVDPLTLNDLAGLMSDGRAVRRNEIEKVAGPDIWDDLIESLDSAGIGEEYRYLEPMALDRWVSIGIKRGLTGGQDGDYLWFLAPIADIDGTPPGNAVVMEASGADVGRATYLFQIASPAEYAAISDRASLDRVISERLHDLTHAMLAINFRREPIYLSRDRLSEPEYANYRSALRLVPALERLRDAFVGRVSHRSADQWRRDIDELLTTAVEETLDGPASSRASNPEGGS